MQRIGNKRAFDDSHKIIAPMMQSNHRGWFIGQFMVKSVRLLVVPYWLLLRLGKSDIYIGTSIYEESVAQFHVCSERLGALEASRTGYSKIFSKEG